MTEEHPDSARTASAGPPETRLPSVLAAPWWAFKVAWTTNPALAAGFIALAVLGSLAPGGIALVARGLINGAIHEIRQGSHDLGSLLPWLAAGVALGAIEALTPLAARFCRERLADDLNLEITPEVLSHAAKLDLAAFEDEENREIIDQAQKGAAETIIRFVTELQSVLNGVIQTVLLVAILTHVEPLVLLVVGPLGLPYLLFQWREATTRHSREAGRNVKRRWTRYFASALMGHRSAAEIKLLGIAPLFVERFRSVMTGFRDEDRKALFATFAQSSAFALLTTLGLYAVFVRAAIGVVHGRLTVGDLAVFAAASPRLRASLDRAIVALSHAREQALSIECLLAFFRLQPRVHSGRGVVPTPEQGELEIEDVWFGYPGTGTPVLAGTSLTLRRGEIVALVGRNGVGKTTLVKLIARLYDPDRGRIRLDGMDLRDWPLVELHRRIAFVSQEALHFEATAYDNIAYGDWPRMAEDREGVREAAAAAGAEELIGTLPEGYDTMLGRTFGEHELSGGQWQKIALARAFARDGSILVLDEPTTHLDAGAEHELQRRLRDLARGRTTLLISHRLETLRLADRLLVMEHGRITTEATHAELAAQAADRASPFATGRHSTLFDASG